MKWVGVGGSCVMVFSWILESERTYVHVTIVNADCSSVTGEEWVQIICVYGIVVSSSFPFYPSGFHNSASTHSGEQVLYGFLLESSPIRC